MSKSFDVDQDEITPLSQFVASRNLKPTQRQRYEVGASDDIMHFINRGGGQSMGTECESSTHFPSLQRLKGDTKKSDMIKYLPTKYKVEQKSAGNWNKEDKSWKWQHRTKTPVEIFTFMWNWVWGYLLVLSESSKFHSFLWRGIDGHTGGRGWELYQGWWFSYQVMKEHLTELKTNDDLDKLAIDQCPIYSLKLFTL